MFFILSWKRIEWVPIFPFCHILICNIYDYKGCYTYNLIWNKYRSLLHDLFGFSEIRNILGQESFQIIEKVCQDNINFSAKYLSRKLLVVETFQTNIFFIELFPVLSSYTRQGSRESIIVEQNHCKRVKYFSSYMLIG